ncbi:MAG: hypothetical protein V2I38_05540 [Alcanivoracaceae bacterium]|jgi:ABC-type phosphate transport system substrate-binding protein|nr:hypothetical protein [Alcanivoracaceae bacterium]
MKKWMILLLLSWPLLGQAELVVVTGSNSDLTSLTENEVRQLFSGQLKVVGGKRMQPLDLPTSSKDRENFYAKLMGRSPEQMRAYWTRLIFTGQGKPPREVSSIQELTNLVNSGEYIGYLRADALTDNVQVLYRIQ